MWTRIENPVCRQRSANNKPRARWLDKPRQFLVEDGDHDQVLGTITCGTAPAERILWAGMHDLPAGASPPCTVLNSDGQDQVTVTLSP